MDGHVPWIRTFAAAVAAAHGVPPDDVADVRLAMSEMASAISRTSPRVDVEVTITLSGDRLVYSLQPCVLDDDPDIDPWDVVCALFADARLVDGRATFSVLVPVEQ